MTILKKCRDGKWEGVGEGSTGNQTEKRHRRNSQDDGDGKSQGVGYATSLPSDQSRWDHKDEGCRRKSQKNKQTNNNLSHYPVGLTALRCYSFEQEHEM